MDLLTIQQHQHASTGWIARTEKCYVHWHIRNNTSIAWKFQVTHLWLALLPLPPTESICICWKKQSKVSFHRFEAGLKRSLTYFTCKNLQPHCWRRSRAACTVGRLSPSSLYRLLILMVQFSHSLIIDHSQQKYWIRLHDGPGLFLRD